MWVSQQLCCIYINFLIMFFGLGFRLTLFITAIEIKRYISEVTYQIERIFAAMFPQTIEDVYRLFNAMLCPKEIFNRCDWEGSSIVLLYITSKGIARNTKSFKIQLLLFANKFFKLLLTTKVFNHKMCNRERVNHCYSIVQFFASYQLWLPL